jgi:uncharacterized protein DUF2760
MAQDPAVLRKLPSWRTDISMTQQVVTDDSRLTFVTRLWIWLQLVRVLFDERFAARVRSVTSARQLAGSSAAPTQQPTTPVGDSVRTTTAALQLLSLLQREGRLVDFLEQDIAAFSDAEIGAAARVVHEGCRKALHAHAKIEPVFVDDEGKRVEVAAGFDADEVKLIGDVRGAPPYRGVLRHRGWRAASLHLPQIVGEHDAHVLAPAEVELG